MEMIPQSPASHRRAGPSGFTFTFTMAPSACTMPLPYWKRVACSPPCGTTPLFRERLTVLNDTVAWDLDGNRDPAACIDLDPCELYESCPVVEDPLKERFDRRFWPAKKLRSTKPAPPSFGLAAGTGQHRSFPSPGCVLTTSTPKPRAEGRVRSGGDRPAPTEPAGETSPSAPAKKPAKTLGFRRFPFFMCCMVMWFTLVRTLFFLIWFYPFSIVPIPSSTQNAPDFGCFRINSGASLFFAWFFAA